MKAKSYKESQKETWTVLTTKEAPKWTILATKDTKIDTPATKSNTSEVAKQKNKVTTSISEGQRPAKTKPHDPAKVKKVTGNQQHHRENTIKNDDTSDDTNYNTNGVTNDGINDNKSDTKNNN
ncbi:hypothetical protein C2G38_2193808 [Gigaspora rosea]|uniref:Uncharacterized protein n=1 Tax=Gigaspora rosea TaxID=44941 RepID=A0A397UXB7_9GLOM|nr:hypothetical protein C2G38_2193808 [Gigaspora rosea]